MKHRFLYRIVLFVGLLFFFACEEKENEADIDFRITSIVPTSGPVGTAVQIKGMGFGEDASSVRVLFGEINAPIDNVRDTLIMTRVPQGGSTGAITVRVGDNSVESMQSFSVETPRERVINDYLNNYLPAGENRDRWTGNSDNCEAGDLSDALKQATLQRLLYFRRQVGYTHDLPLNADRSRICQEAAMLMRANGRRPVTHAPPMSYRCWTQEGRNGANASNLARSTIARGAGYATRGVFLFIEDPGATNKYVQHRVSLLRVAHSEAGRAFVGVGATDVTLALSLESGTLNSTDVIFPERTPDFVSWPPDNYVMDELVYPRWSFHFIKNSPATRSPLYGYTLENVSVEMTRKDTGERIDFKEPHNRPQANFADAPIVWRPDLPLKRTHPLGHIIDISGEDVTYVIKVMNIGSANGPLNYTYEVTIIDAQSVPSVQAYLRARKQDASETTVH